MFLGDNTALPPAYRVKVEKCASFVDVLDVCKFTTFSDRKGLCAVARRAFCACVVAMPDVRASFDMTLATIQILSEGFCLLSFLVSEHSVAARNTTKGVLSWSSAHPTRCLSIQVCRWVPLPPSLAPPPLLLRGSGTETSSRLLHSRRRNLVSDVLPSNAISLVSLARLSRGKRVW